MSENIIILDSVTHAFKARDILYKSGIKTEIIKTPKEINSCGCGYSLKLDSNLNKAEQILSEHKIETKGTAVI